MPITSTETLVRAALKARMDAVDPPIGRVWDDEQFSVVSMSWPTDDDEAVMGWEIVFGDKQGRFVERRLRADTGTVLVFRTYILRGFRTIDQENNSSGEFRDQVTEVVNRLTENLNLVTGINLVVESLPEVVTWTTAMYEERLCHLAEVEVVTVAEEHVPEWTGG